MKLRDIYHRAADAADLYSTLAAVVVILLAAIAVLWAFRLYRSIKRGDNR